MANKKYNRKKNLLKREYPNGGDGMFFYHKKTGHPAKQISHTEKTWTNRRYTHHPNRNSNYVLDEELSSPEEPIYYQKTIFTDGIYTRGRPFVFKKKKR